MSIWARNRSILTVSAIQNRVCEIVPAGGDGSRCIVSPGSAWPGLGMLATRRNVRKMSDFIGGRYVRLEHKLCECHGEEVNSCIRVGENPFRSRSFPGSIPYSQRALMVRGGLSGNE